MGLRGGRRGGSVGRRDLTISGPCALVIVTFSCSAVTAAWALWRVLYLTNAAHLLAPPCSRFSLIRYTSSSAPYGAIMLSNSLSSHVLGKLPIKSRCSDCVEGCGGGGRATALAPKTLPITPPIPTPIPNAPAAPGFGSANFTMRLE